MKTDVLQRGFITAESFGGKGCVKITFPTLEETQQAHDELLDVLRPSAAAPVEDKRDAFERWMLSRKHEPYGWIDSHWLERGENGGYLVEFVHGAWTVWESSEPAVLEPEPTAYEYVGTSQGRVFSSFKADHTWPKPHSDAEHDYIIGEPLYRRASPAQLDKNQVKAELYDEVWEIAKHQGFMNVTMALAKLAALLKDPQGVSLLNTRANRVYVAGPMTGLPEYNYPAFNDAAAKLRAIGCHVENPADHGFLDGATWGDYMAYDLTRLGTCSVVALLPGWQNSKGARIEVMLAHELGMAVTTVGYLTRGNTDPAERGAIDEFLQHLKTATPVIPLPAVNRTCLACGETHYGLAGLPCPKMRATA